MAKCPSCGGEMEESETFNAALERVIMEIPRLIRGLPESLRDQLLRDIQMCRCVNCGLLMAYERR